VSEPSVRRFRGRLLAILATGILVRIVYVLLQPRFDPAFARPILDGAYYTDLARSLASGGSVPGVYYMPPLYPWALAAFFRLFGESWSVIYVIQHAAIVVAAGLLALVARRAAGDAAGLGTAALALLYHPALFFASRPLGEPLALLLLSAAVLLASRDDTGSAAGAGVASGLASLVRPNVLPLPFVWAAREAGRKAWGRAALLAAGTVLMLLPTACHNHAVSGHWIPVSANGGIVFWLGNAPGAVGVYTPSAGFTGALATQQQESINEAGARAGRRLDAVEADGFWWREGLSARGADPAGTLKLLGLRAGLTLDNAEHGLDYAPALDRNPARWVAPLPFALLLALALFGLVAVGAKGTGGFPLWSAVLVAAAAPLAFYVSSRHRLPVAFLLTVPAGAGLAMLPKTRRWIPFAAALAALAGSLAWPSRDLVRSEHAAGLASLADLQRKNGDLASAVESARRATELDPSSAVAWFNRGVVEAVRGNVAEAERDYLAALAADPTQPDAAANLAGILVASGRAAEAPPLLEKALAVWPRHSVGWTNLVVAYAASGDLGRARDAVRRGEVAGVALDPDLVKTVQGDDGR
jgi:tetratricopeptide (TPR) repeat protein